jgi:hypothetical protein
MRKILCLERGTCGMWVVTVGYLALGDLVSLFAEKLVGDGSFAFLVQHSKANLPL